MGMDDSWALAYALARTLPLHTSQRMLAGACAAVSASRSFLKRSTMSSQLRNSADHTAAAAVAAGERAATEARLVQVMKQKTTAALMAAAA
jgi:hypothetical protein